MWLWTGHHPRLAPCGSRTRLRRDAWLRSDRRARRGCGWVLAITRGLRHAAHGLACGVMRGCVPIVVQEGAVAGYWPSPAACAMRLTTRGLRHAAHGRRLRRGVVVVSRQARASGDLINLPRINSRTVAEFILSDA
jgi:hypothetical protein